MASGKFVTYYRVSTAQQGKSGLGLEAQRETVKSFLNGGDWEVVGEFQEEETGKGSDALAKRPKLREALALCKTTGARLLIAKLDRLARNVHFISGLMETKVGFVACDMPEANELTVHMMAAFAQHEAKMISQRTKDALAAAKARGVKLGVAGSVNLKPNIEERQVEADRFAASLAVTIKGFQAQGVSQRGMVEELNKLGVKAARGGTWSLNQVQCLIKRIG